MKSDLKNDVDRIVICKIRDYFCDGNASLLARKLGKAPQYVSALCNGDRGIGGQTRKLIADTFPMVNVEWLMTGEGEMLKKADAPQPMEVSDVADAFALSQSGAPHKIPMQFDANGELLAQYEIRIAELKERIAELNARIAQQERYIAILSEEHRDLVHQAIGKLDEGVDGIKLIQKKIC